MPRTVSGQHVVGVVEHDGPGDEVVQALVVVTGPEQHEGGRNNTKETGTTKEISDGMMPRVPLQAADDLPGYPAGVPGSEGFGSVGHLLRRFVGALSPAGPPAADEAWATASLLPGEREWWWRMSGPDRRHAVGVARDVASRLGPQRASRQVVAAALLHDVGKVASGLGTFGRVGVTVAALAAGRDRLAVWSDDHPEGEPASGSPTNGPHAPVAPGCSAWTGRSHLPWRVRAGRYLVHDRIGAALLAGAGSAPLTVAWAGEHHLPSDRWSVGAEVAAALKAADGD